MDSIIIVQNRNAHAIDWPSTVAGSSRNVFLVCDGLTRDRLAERGWTALFREIHGIFPCRPSVVRDMVSALARRLGDPGDVSICANHEDDVEICAALREECGLSGPRPADVARFRDKLVMKDCLADRPEWLPRYLRFEPRAYAADPATYARHAAARLGFPMFAKPIDGCGSQGTHLIETEAELHAWAGGIGEDTVYELDEFLSGTLYHCDFIVFGGQILDRQVARYLYPNGSFLHGKPLASLAIPGSEEAHQALGDFSLQVLERFRPWPDGAMHMEVFRLPNGECRFLEIACRAPGANIPALHKAQCGLDYRAAPYELALKGTLRREPPLARHCATAWFPSLPGQILGFREYRSSGSAVSMQIVREAASTSLARTLADRVAELLLWSDDYRQIEADFEALRDYHPAVMATPTGSAGGRNAAGEEREAAS